MNNKNCSSDYSSCKVYKPKLKLEQTVNTCWASAGDTITYFTTISNVGNMPAMNIVVMDLLLSPLEFIECSVNINGEPYPDLNILSGIPLGGLSPNEYIEISFKVKVNGSGNINNKIIASYEYQVPGCYKSCGNDESNVATVCVIDTNLNMSICCDRNSVSLNDIINYTITLKNDGDVELLNVVIKNNLPKFTKMISDSFMVNGQNIYCVDLNKGFTLPSICQNEVVTITYSIQIVYTPCSAKYTTDLRARICYRLPNGCLNSREISCDNNCTINIGMCTFKQLSIDKYIRISPGTPEIECLNSVKGNICIKEHHIFKTPKGTSNEGQNLTGYKVFIRGTWCAQVDYTSCSAIQSVHCNSYDVPFSTFIVLPHGYNIGCGLEITGDIEDIFFKEVDCKTAFISATALINVKILTN